MSLNREDEGRDGEVEKEKERERSPTCHMGTHKLPMALVFLKYLEKSNLLEKDGPFWSGLVVFQGKLFLKTIHSWPLPGGLIDSF